MQKRNYFIFIAIAVLLILGIIFFIKEDDDNQNNAKMNIEQTTKTQYKIKDVKLNDNFNLNIMKVINANNSDNYLISPYSIKIALNMLNEGAKNNTKKEITNALKSSKILDVSSNNVKISNALFLKDTYENNIEKKFINNLQSKYNSAVLIDAFNTPDVINKWVKEKTDGMIEKLLDYLDEDFVLGLANALAIDVKWANPFECNYTKEADFTNSSGEIIKVQMMNKAFDNEDVSYFKLEDSEGIILPYSEADDLEFIAIKPKENVNKYVNDLTEEKLEEIDNNKISANDKLYINLSLPRFSYSFSLNDFKDVLNSLGIVDAFDPVNADLNGMIDTKKVEIGNLYVSTAIHKTYIDLNEEGTRAAAVTYFGVNETTAVGDKTYKTVNIDINKSFTYLIRNKTNKEILFWGVVNTPNTWNGSTCEELSILF